MVKSFLGGGCFYEKAKERVRRDIVYFCSESYGVFESVSPCSYIDKREIVRRGFKGACGRDEVLFCSKGVGEGGRGRRESYFFSYEIFCSSYLKVCGEFSSDKELVEITAKEQRGPCSCSDIQWIVSIVSCSLICGGLGYLRTINSEFSGIGGDVGDSCEDVGSWGWICIPDWKRPRS